MKKVFNPLFLLGLFILIPQASANEIDSFKEKIHIEQENFQKGDLTNIDYVKKIIDQMYSLDQETRKFFLKDINNADVQNLIKSMDEFHTAKMKEILVYHGWITISKFGRVSDSQAWSLVQHADHDNFFQAGCLFVLTNLIDRGETDIKNYAYLYDRVALKFENLGMKQKYGTQVIFSDREVTLAPYEGTTDTLNQERRKVGLDSIEAYLQAVKNVYQK